MKDYPVPTERKQIRLILDAGTEHQVIDLARREGRSVSAMVNRLVIESLSARRAKNADTEELLREGMKNRLRNMILGLPDTSAT
jgi:hypothetical protein